MTNLNATHCLPNRSLTRRLGLMLPAWFLFMLATLPVSLHAHPGHAMSEAGWGHLMVSPDHLLVLLASGLAVGFLGRWAQKSLTRRLLQCGGASLALTALVLFCLRF